MTEEAITLAERAGWIADNAKRLKKLVDLNAPALIIESARQSLFKRLMNFPAPAEYVDAWERVHNETRQTEQEFLMAHGYYDDVAGGDAQEAPIARVVSEAADAPIAPAAVPWTETDPLVDQAALIVKSNKCASISLVQRHLRIGYNRAAALLETLEKRGIIKVNPKSGGSQWVMTEGGAA